MNAEKLNKKWLTVNQFPIKKNNNDDCFQFQNIYYNLIKGVSIDQLTRKTSRGDATR